MKINALDTAILNGNNNRTIQDNNGITNINVDRSSSILKSMDLMSRNNITFGLSQQETKVVSHVPKTVDEIISRIDANVPKDLKDTFVLEFIEQFKKIIRYTEHLKRNSAGAFTSYIPNKNGIFYRLIPHPCNPYHFDINSKLREDIMGAYEDSCDIYYDKNMKIIGDTTYPIEQFTKLKTTNTCLRLPASFGDFDCVLFSRNTSGDIGCYIKTNIKTRDRVVTYANGDVHSIKQQATEATSKESINVDIARDDGNSKWYKETDDTQWVEFMQDGNKYKAQIEDDSYGITKHLVYLIN